MNRHECKQVLPSAQSSMDVWQGKPGSWIDIGRDILQRSALIAGGLWLAGDKDVVKKSLIASSVIEAFVLLEAKSHLDKQEAAHQTVLSQFPRQQQFPKQALWYLGPGYYVDVYGRWVWVA